MLMMFCIVAADRNPGVAALAQGHKVAFVVRATVCKRQDVMHFLGGSQPAFAPTLLAKRMRLNIELTNASPRAAVLMAGVWIALVSVVLVHDDLPVLITVPTVGQPAATGIGARTLGFSRQ